MSLPWLKDDYKRQESKSRSRSRSGSRTRRSRSRSPRNDKEYGGRGRDSSRPRGGGKQVGRSSERVRRKRSRSNSSSSSNDSRDSATRLVASTKQKYVNSRIFVANISSKDLTKNDIVARFEKYGNVVDCLIHPKNYIFVQYLREEHARLAVEGENGSTFNGFRMDVKMANERRKPQRDGGAGSHDLNRPPPRNRDRERIRDPYGPDPFIHERRAHPHFPPGSGDFGARDPYFPPDPYRRGYPPEPWMPSDDPYRREPYGDPYRDPYGPRGPPPPPHHAPVGPVECEVFIVSAPLRTYGEIIERRVKDQSIITSLSIIPEGRTAPQMVEELTIKGGLFAIFLNAQNETHRSLTLNILHGTPQEHRNMPLDDAIGLIGRSFEKYVEELRTKANTASIASQSASSGSTSRIFLPPSSEVKYLLNLLADNQALTVTELDSVIKYLQERREKLIDVDKRSSTSQEKDKKEDAKSSKTEEKSKDDDDSQMKATHEELTKKILSYFQGVEPNIANKLAQSSSSVSQVPAPPPAPAPPAKTSTSTSGSGSNLINFDNPNVQKALNNLIQSGPDLLKSFTSSGESPASSMAMGGGMINSAPMVSGMGETGMAQMSQAASMMAMGNPIMGNQGMGNPDMGMGMFGQQQLEQAQAAAMLAAFNMPGMMSMGAGVLGAGPMGGGGLPGGMGQDFNFQQMPNQNGPPPPPPPNQMF